MPRIPNIQKFRGDNSQSFLNWIRQFEAQLAANGIEDDRKRDVLLYSPLKLQTITNLHIKTQKTCWKRRTQGQITEELLSRNLDHCVFVRV